MLELLHEEDAARSPAVSADSGLSGVDHQMLGFKDDAPLLYTVRSSSVRKKKRSSTTMTTTRSKKKVKRASTDEEVAQAEAKGVAKAESVNDAILGISGTLKPEAESSFQVLQFAMKEFYLVISYLVSWKSCMSWSPTQLRQRT